jgi:Tol biopolymer transport system component
VTREGFDPAWSPDGQSLAYATEPVRDPYARYGSSQLWRVDVVSGNTAQLTESDAVQPDWSPDGGRIAYWANNGGQRDIWTVSASGGDPVPVTHDAATDWSPEWSPDGAWLYFSSDRGGNMNIWRVAIDQQTGIFRAAPEAITNSFTGVGYVRFATDQQRAVVMAYSTTYELLLTAADDTPARRPEPTSVRSPSLGWCSPSPASDWLACTSRAAQEDIVLVRPNGSETVRLTDDAPKDRNPTWSPDGSRIAFMSTRSGQSESWSIRRDGSDLRQMTNLQSDIYDTVWSADGRRAMTASSTRAPYGTWIYDVASMATRENATFFQSPVAPRLNVEAWSPDGKLVAGSILDGTGSPRQPVVWEIATGLVRTLDVPPPLNEFSFAVAGWLPDSRRFLFASGTGIVVVDATTGKWTPFPAPETSSGCRTRDPFPPAGDAPDTDRACRDDTVDVA